MIEESEKSGKLGLGPRKFLDRHLYVSAIEIAACIARVQERDLCQTELLDVLGAGLELLGSLGCETDQTKRQIFLLPSWLPANVHILDFLQCFFILIQDRASEQFSVHVPSMHGRFDRIVRHLFEFSPGLVGVKERGF